MAQRAVPKPSLSEVVQARTVNDGFKQISLNPSSRPPGQQAPDPDQFPMLSTQPLPQQSPALAASSQCWSSTARTGSAPSWLLGNVRAQSQPAVPSSDASSHIRPVVNVADFPRQANPNFDAGIPNIQLQAGPNFSLQANANFPLPHNATALRPQSQPPGFQPPPPGFQAPVRLSIGDVVRAASTGKSISSSVDDDFDDSMSYVC